METIREAWDVIRPHLGTVGLVLTWIGIATAYVRKRSQWRQKRFTGHVNFSLNYVRDGALQLRTLLETTTSEVWLNDHGVRIVLAAANLTRPDQPFIILNDPTDMAFVKRAALNVLSEKFATAFLATSLGMQVKAAQFYFALTFENHPDMRTRKFRVLLVESRGLLEMFGPSAPEPKVLEPNHRDRLRVLQTMANFASGASPDDRKVLGTVELGIPI